MRQEILNKLEEIKKHKDETIAHLNALIGAENVLNELLKEMDVNEQNTDN